MPKKPCRPYTESTSTKRARTYEDGSVEVETTAKHTIKKCPLKKATPPKNAPDPTPTPTPTTEISADAFDVPSEDPWGVPRIEEMLACGEDPTPLERLPGDVESFFA